MVVLDNAKNPNGEFKKSYSKNKIDRIVTEALIYWPDSVPKPDLALISPGKNSEGLSLLRNLSNWIDFQQ